MNATAKKQGDHWVLNGTKNFITHGKSCDLAVVIFRNGEKGDSHGMTSFVIEKGTIGFEARKSREQIRNACFRNIRNGFRQLYNSRQQSPW